MPVIWRTTTVPVHICLTDWADIVDDLVKRGEGQMPCERLDSPGAWWDGEAGGSWHWDKPYCPNCGEEMERGLIQPKTKKVKSGKPQERAAALDSDGYGYVPGSQRPAPEFGPDAYIDSFGHLRMHIHDS